MSIVVIHHHAPEDTCAWVQNKSIRRTKSIQGSRTTADDRKPIGCKLEARHRAQKITTSRVAGRHLGAELQRYCEKDTPREMVLLPSPTPLVVPACREAKARCR